MPDSYSWLQLTKDILVPLSSSLVGAGIAYLATMKSGEKQSKLNEREQALRSLDRVYELLQEVEAHARYCLHEYPGFIIPVSFDMGKKSADVISRVNTFSTLELERLIELNFSELKVPFSEVKKLLRKMSLLFGVGGAPDAGVLNGAYRDFEPKIAALMNKVVAHRSNIMSAKI